MPPQLPASHLIYAIAFLLMTPTVILSWTSLVTPYELKASYGTEEAAALVITPREGAVGPSLWLGVFRSCSRLNDSNSTKCDYSSHLKWKPDYDVSVLPSSAPLFTLRVPPPQLRALAWITTFLSTLLWILTAGMGCTFYLFRQPGGRELTPRSTWWTETLRAVCASAIACVALFGFITYAIIWVHFKKACDNFNVIYRRPGHPLKDEPDIRAHLGNCFRIAYTGYILLLAPFTIVFVELLQDRGIWYQPVPSIYSTARESPAISSRTSNVETYFSISDTGDFVQQPSNAGNSAGAVMTQSIEDLGSGNDGNNLSGDGANNAAWPSAAPTMLNPTQNNTREPNSEEIRLQLLYVI